VFRSSLSDACSCRPFSFVLSNLMRADNPPRRILFFYQTELVCAGCRSVHGDRIITSKGFVLYLTALTPRVGAISPAIIREFPAHVRWSCCAMPACLESPPAIPFFFSEPLCEMLSHGIVKHVTPLRRCENIRSLDRHLRQSRDRLSVWPNRLNRQLSERGCL
jgi:hypothetical protein